MKKEEQELIKKAQKGETEAFGNLYDKYLPPIYRFVFFRVGSKADAEDICHQVFLSAWKNIERFKIQEFPFSSWLYKIAVNAVIDHWRTKKNNVSIDLVSENFFADQPDFENTLDVKIDLQFVKNALAKMEPTSQNVLIMKFVEDLSNKEIAQALDKSEGAIRVIQHRALKQLKNIIDENSKTA